MPILPEPKPPAARRRKYRCLAEVPGLQAAIEKHRGDPIFTDGPPKPDFLTDLRTVAKLLALLQHDSDARRMLLKSVGAGASAVSPRLLARLAEDLLGEADRAHSSEEFLWCKYPDPDRNGDAPSDGLNTRRLSEVVEQEVEWLWPQRVPLGKVTLLSGDPDLGKTWVVLDLIARITTGRDFPDAPNPFVEGSTYSARRDALWVSGEDADEDTIKPRVMKLDGDVSRVHSLATVVDVETDKKHRRKKSEQTLDLSRHLNWLDEWLTAHPLVVVVAIDPFAAFLGKIDSHRNSDVRALLTPLAKLAHKHRVAVIGINHLAKGDGENAMYRGMGSVAFVAAARSSWQVTRDPKEPKDRRLFTKVKANLASEDVGGLAFRVGPTVAGSFLWEKGRVETSANEALSTAAATRAPALAEAKEWLREFLKDGPKRADEVWEKAKADGINDKTLKTAKAELGVGSEKTGGTGAPWVWSLPKPKS